MSRKITKIIKHQIREFHDFGMTCVEIGNCLDVPHSTVSKWTLRLGLREGNQYIGRRYKVVHDPNNIFSEHSEFTITEIKATLEVGNWPHGMRFELNGNGKTLEVQKKDRRFILVEIVLQGESK